MTCIVCGAACAGQDGTAHAQLFLTLKHDGTLRVGHAADCVVTSCFLRKWLVPLLLRERVLVALELRPNWWWPWWRERAALLVWRWPHVLHRGHVLSVGLLGRVPVHGSFNKEHGEILHPLHSFGTVTGFPLF